MPAVFHYNAVYQCIKYHDRQDSRFVLAQKVSCRCLELLVKVYGHTKFSPFVCDEIYLSIFECPMVMNQLVYFETLYEL